MVTNRSRTLGFTLVEILVTMVILSMVMLTGAFAYNYIAQNWERNQNLYNRAEQSFFDWTFVTRAKHNMLPKLVRDNREQLGFYFLGREEGFTAYTASAAQNPDFPAVFRLFRERMGNGDGWQLVYEEALLDQVRLINDEQTLPFNYRLVLQSGIQSLEFEYLGWPGIDERRQAINDPGVNELDASWFSEFDGMSRQQHPLVVQILIDDFIWPTQITDITEELLRPHLGEGA